MILNSPYITGSITVTGNANIQGQLTVTGSLSGTATSASYAYTASSAINAFSASNAISSSYSATASFSNDFTVLGNLTVFGTQSVQYITSSQLNISDNVITVNVASPGVRFGGLAVFDSGSQSSEATASLFWDSQNNHWVYQRESGSTYNGGMLISGPRNSGGLGNELGTTACMLLVGQGGDHLTSSMIYHSSTETCFPNCIIAGGALSGTTATFSSNITAMQGIFALSTNGSAIGCVRNLTLLNSSEAIGNWSGINFSYSNSGTNFGYIGTVITTDVNNSLADLVFGVKASNSVTAVTEYMRIKGGGNVGIGNTNPLSPLHIGGALVSSGDAAAITLKQTGTNETTGIYLERSGERKGYAIYVGGSVDSLVFQRNNAGTKSDVMTLTRDGNVSIGNQNPTTKLVVNNAIAGAILPYINGTGLSYNSEGISVAGSNTSNGNIGNGLTLYNNVSSVGAYSPVIAFSSMTPGGAYNATYAFITGIYQGAGGDTNWAKGDLMFGTGNSYGATERMRIAANGDFTIGNCSTASTKNVYWSEGAGEFQLNGGPGSNSVGATGATLRIGNNTTGARRFWSLQLDGSNQLGTWYYAEGVGWSKLGYQTTGGTWTNSDQRRKENIVSSNYGLNEVLQLTPKKFNFKIDERKIQNLGFIAQEVLPIIPEAVQSDEDDGQQYYAMNYANLVPVLVKAIQELKAENDIFKTCLGIS